MSKKLTTEEFIQKAKEVHGDKYDYSKAIYQSNNSPIDIICPTHGLFSQLPANHLRGFGCKQCSAQEKSKNSKSTLNEFIEKARKVHGDKFDYSLVEYKNANTKVKIKCNTCGKVFEQTPGSHLYGRGCPYCYGNRNMGLEGFIEKARKIHGDRYDYSKSEYVNSKTPICIICKDCRNEFWQTPDKHLLGQGCPRCGASRGLEKRTKPQDDFIEQANKVHNGKYDYTQVHYINTHTPVDIICPEHGLFSQTPKAHLSGQGCPQCAIQANADKKRLDLSEFINKANVVHKDKYDYANSNYRNTGTPVEIICPIHGPFMQDPHNHLQGAGCPKCANNLSKAEEEIVVFLRGLGLKVEQHNHKILNRLELDIYLPNEKLAIEYNGLYWHNESNGKDRQYHLKKTEECEKQGIRLIHIFEDEWVGHKDIVLSRLKTILGVNNANRYYARDCQIKEVETKVAKQFLVMNHLQGDINATYYYGLYNNEELVSLMTFGALRQRKAIVEDYDERYELLRFCNKIETTIVGGASKLLKHFIDNVKPKSILTYADRRWSDGNLYKQLGFTHTHNSAPNYYYIINGTRENRFKFHKANLVKQGFDPNKSEHEIMLEQGIYRIYDCGNMAFEMRFDNENDKTTPA